MKRGIKMTSIEKWNLIVDEHQRLYSSLEEEVQNAWEMYCAELFGYKKLLHEIDAQRHLSVGSGGAIIPDIILKIDGKDIFDIELKKYSLQFHESFEAQLISYLNQTHLSAGMIVCSKIYLYYYEYATILVNKIEIPFEKDNPDGIALMDMLTKDSFSTEKIRDYISEKQKHEKNILKIHQQLKNSNWINQIIRDKLLEQFSGTDVDNILNKYTIRVLNQGESNSPKELKHSSLLTIPSTGSSLDISPAIREWCIQKTKIGDLNFLYTKSSKKYTRFTTLDLDQIIPYQNDLKSGWNNGHFYAYEIINYNNEFKIVLTFCNINAPMQVKDIFALAMTLANKLPRTSDWQWKYIFSTKSFSYTSETTAEEIYQALDSQFTQIRAQVSALLKEIEKRKRA